jgi:dipeptidyl-peptidase-3
MLRSPASFNGIVVTLIAVLSLGSAGCPDGRESTPAPPSGSVQEDSQPSGGGPAPRAELLETIAGIAVVRLPPDGWSALTPRQRLLAWHLTQAAIAGRDIYWDQIHPRNLAVRSLMEGLYRHRERLDPDFSGALTEYTKRLWLNNGFYEERTCKKFVPVFTPSALSTALAALLESGVAPAELGIPPGQTPEAYLASLRRTIFESEFQPLLADKTPGENGDLLANSAVNFYRGVTLAEVEAWAADGGESHPLNSRVVRVSGRIAEEVWRAGTEDGEVPPGRYAEALGRVIAHLERALPYAGTEQATGIRRLIRFYRSGSAADWEAFAIAWLAFREPVVDTVNGFIETYKDPRSQKGAYEGIVHIVDPDRTRLMAKLAAHAGYFEERVPWDPAFKRRQFRSPVATVVNLLAAVGDGGPQCALGINLPNEEEIRSTHGAKSVTLGNVLLAYDDVVFRAAVDEFALPGEREAAREHGELISFLQTSMHEVLGHASGAVSPDLPGSPPDRLKEHYNALEEARAELVALHHFWDPKLWELAGIESDAVARAAYQAYARGALVMMRRVKTGTILQDDHMRATALIVEFLKDSGCIEQVTENGKTFYRVASFAQMRHGVAALLTELQRIKATGDRPSADLLLQAYATELDPQLRDEVVRRAEAAGIPDRFAVVFPRLVPVLDEEGRMVDVETVSDEDLAGQMLRLSAAGREEPS